ncbi:hypothetical protein P879_08858 [Paragonimus westermani]|uniref:Uncharacterized protein n=1 Tax=Paragonimus westermani TaxID=34504 RepID=A0A8T0DDS9_9TREM|nr:hypothetical protein P879_08858 [Paragonimus westermani]
MSGRRGIGVGSDRQFLLCSDWLQGSDDGAHKDLFTAKDAQPTRSKFRRHFRFQALSFFHLNPLRFHTGSPVVF